jgi:hypothetical protein
VMVIVVGRLSKHSVRIKALRPFVDECFPICKFNHAHSSPAVLRRQNMPYKIITTAHKNINSNLECQIRSKIGGGYCGRKL